MTDPLISTSAFHWILTAAVGAVSALWVVHDLLFLSRLRKANAADPLVRDQKFGYAMGVVIAIIGVVGSLLFMHHNGVI